MTTRSLFITSSVFTFKNLLIKHELMYIRHKVHRIA
jgi:hypothetical protein